MNKLDAFLKDAKIDKDELMNALYLDIREIILKAVINKMKTEKDYFSTSEEVPSVVVELRHAGKQQRIY